MITIKNKTAISKMREAGKRLNIIFDRLHDFIRPGVTTLDIEELIARQQKELGLVSKSKGYKGYCHVSCISVNDEVVHGIPSDRTVLRDGDFLSVDVCCSWEDYCADMARHFFVGKVDARIHHLAEVAQKALDAGIAQARPGNKIGDISAAIQAIVEDAGYGIVRDFAGHGIGKRMHEDPEILNYGTAGKGMVLRAGMTIAIEPMITMGNYKVYVEKDGWTVRTVDHSIAAHVEDTIAITDNGPAILTRV